MRFRVGELDCSEPSEIEMISCQLRISSTLRESSLGHEFIGLDSIRRIQDDENETDL